MASIFQIHQRQKWIEWIYRVIDHFSSPDANYLKNAEILKCSLSRLMELQKQNEDQNLPSKIMLEEKNKDNLSEYLSTCLTNYLERFGYIQDEFNKFIYSAMDILVQKNHICSIVLNYVKSLMYALLFVELQHLHKYWNYSQIIKAMRSVTNYRNPESGDIIDFKYDAIDILMLDMLFNQTKPLEAIKTLITLCQGNHIESTTTKNKEELDTIIIRWSDNDEKPLRSPLKINYDEDMIDFIKTAFLQLQIQILINIAYFQGQINLIECYKGFKKLNSIDEPHIKTQELNNYLYERFGHRMPFVLADSE